MARPTSADSSETHARILEAALAEIQERGGVHVSFRGVAARAGLSTGTIQYYFGGRDELLEACLDGYHKRLGAVVEELVAGAKADPGIDPVPILEDGVRTLHRFIETEQALVSLRLALNEEQGELPPMRQRESLTQLLGMAADVLIELGIELERTELVLTTQALTAVMVRFGRLSEGEREAMLGEGATRQDVEDFLVRHALRALGVRR